MEEANSEDEKEETNGDEDSQMIGKTEEVEKPIKSLFETDWEEIKKELSFDGLWNKPWADIATNFFVCLFIGLIPSVYDVVSDCLLAKDLIVGTYYIKNIANVSELNVNIVDPHPSLHTTQEYEANLSNPYNCTHIGRFITYTDHGSEITYDRIQCFEQDPIWGYICLVVIFLPGYYWPLFFFRYQNYLKDYMKDVLKNSILSFLLMIVGIPCFPLLLICVKCVSLIASGENWKKFSADVAFLEGMIESQCQFLLQLFIIFSRADRQPSTIQLGSLLISLVMLVKTSVARSLQDQQPFKTLGEELEKSVTLFPRMLTNSISTWGSLAVILAVLRYTSILFYICVTLSVCIVYGIGFAINKGLNKKEKNTLSTTSGEHPQRVLAILSLRMMKCSFLLTLIVIVVIANVNQQIVYELQFSKIWNAKSVEDIAIVENITLLNITCSVIIISGVISEALYYIQVWKPMQNSDKNTNDPDAGTTVTTAKEDLSNLSNACKKFFSCGPIEITENENVQMQEIIQK